MEESNILIKLCNRIYPRLRKINRLYCIFLNVAFRANLLSEFEIPIIINNFNRLASLKLLIEFLEGRGYKNITVIDNDSTYPPLLDYYKQCSVKVIHLNANLGHLAFWKSGLYKGYRWNYFVYTDPDVVPIEQCPANFLGYFRKLLTKYRGIDKAGFGIKIDDLSESFHLKESVVEYEKKYWRHEVEQNVFQAAIDTTFALYRPFSNRLQDEVYTLPALRVGHPYLLRHMPWYVNSDALSEEDQYYLQTCNTSSSIGKQLAGKATIY